MSVDARLRAVILRTESHPGNVLQYHARAIGIGAQQDAFELRNGAQGRAPLHDDVELLPGHRWCGADLSNRHLGVLILNRCRYVCRGEVKAVQFVRVQPHAHGVLTAEHVRFANAGYASNRIEHAGRNVIAQCHFIEAVVHGREREEHHEVAGGLRDDDALLLHRLRQARKGQLHFVLHLDLRGIRICAGAEIQRDDRQS